MTGTWTINRELSPSFTAPGGPGGRRRGGGPAFALAGGFQGRGGGRGGGGGGDAGPSGPGDLTPEELAGQAAIRQLQQIAPQITIKASADAISFADPRGEQTYAIDGKSTKLDLAGAKISVKTKWDKQALRQEFSNTKTNLIRTWELDDAGHLLMKARLESMTFNTVEVKAVFDRQQ
jgi:hypothetical protein